MLKVISVHHAPVQTGEPVEINPSIGHGFKIMPVAEWSARWKRNDDFPDCLQCKGTNTKEHHFTQVHLGWCSHWSPALQHGTTHAVHVCNCFCN